MTCAKGGWRWKDTPKEKKQEKDVCRARQEATEAHVKREKTRKRRVQSSAGGDRSTRQKGNKKKTI